MRFLFLWFILVGFHNILMAQQNTEEIDKEAIHRAEQCEFHRKISATKLLHTDYAYVKGFRLCGTKCDQCQIKKGIIRLVLEAGNEYSLKISNWRGDTYAVLYDDKARQIGQSLHQGKIYDGFTFICKSTGIYYIRFFDQHERPAHEALIGGAALGLRRWKF